MVWKHVLICFTSGLLYPDSWSTLELYAGSSCTSLLPLVLPLPLLVDFLQGHGALADARETRGGLSGLGRLGEEGEGQGPWQLDSQLSQLSQRSGFRSLYIEISKDD